MSKDNKHELVELQDADKLQFRQQYAAAKSIYVRANDGNMYPTTKEAILRSVKLLGLKVKDLKFFTPESVEAAKKKS